MVSIKGTTAVGASKSGRPPHPSPPRGLLTVAEYVGQEASDAAVAIRRAGLRPGLERSFGWEPELHGQVVHQEPPAGSEVARNAVVTLYIAAPHATPAREESHWPPADAIHNEPALADGAQADAGETPTALAAPRPRRRRKPGGAERKPQIFDTPSARAERDTPAPIRLDASVSVESGVVADEQPPEEWFPDTGVAPLAGLDDPEWNKERLSDDGVDDQSLEELVAHADDLFAGRTSSLWHRVYPGRRRVRLTPTIWS